MLPPAVRPAIPVTKGLIAVMFATFALSIVIGGGIGGSEDPEVLYRIGAQHAGSIWSGQWWRLVTAIFLHAGPLHLLLNGFSLFNLGLFLEPTLGSRRFLVLFFASGLVSGLATLVFVTGTLSVGASGAVFGLAGLLLADELTRRRMYRRVAVEVGPRWRPRVSIIPILVLNLALGLAIPAVNNYAHVGGLVGGFLLGTAWIERNLRHAARSWLAYALLALLVGVLGVAGFRPAFGAAAAARLAGAAFVAAREGRLDEALDYVNEAVAKEPGNARYRYLRATIHGLRGDREAALADGRAACAGGVAEACAPFSR